MKCHQMNYIPMIVIVQKKLVQQKLVLLNVRLSINQWIPSLEYLRKLSSPHRPTICCRLARRHPQTGTVPLYPTAQKHQYPYSLPTDQRATKQTATNSAVNRVSVSPNIQRCIRCLAHLLLRYLRSRSDQTEIVFPQGCM